MDRLMDEEIVFLAGVFGGLSIMMLIGVAAWLLAWVLQWGWRVDLFQTVDRWLKDLGI